jgi:RNA polymerase sigma-70 factor (ECF subfamily)
MQTDNGLNDFAGRFERVRPVLVRHAYRMLGDYSEAEDAVQDAFLRWTRAVQTTAVEDDQAFLRTTVTHLCLDRLRSARARRESYVGPWLPEPVVHEAADGPENAAVLADDLSFALLLALERLDPLERAAFLLHDALGVPFSEVAQTLERSEEAVRKLASRARARVQDAHRAPRVPRNKAAILRDRFLDALQHDDAAALQALLVEDVVLTSDGGGKAVAATVPVIGSDRVTKFFMGVAKKGGANVRRIEFTEINGLPGIVTFDSGGIDLAVAFETDGERIHAIYAVRNPDKLARLGKWFVRPQTP